MASFRKHELLVPEEELEFESTAGLGVPRWVRYGSVVAAVALTAARLGGIAYADDGGHSGGLGHGGDGHGHGGGDGDGHCHAFTQAPASSAAMNNRHDGGSAKPVQVVNAIQV